ncbi:MAG: hypothetical protein F6K35_45055 [Okeania sp. SIO2H7]|nr:hypothetical protein [Okeania sp. SIO2H7]
MIVPPLQRAIAQAEALQDERAIAYATGTLGQWYETQQNWSLARALTHMAIQKAQAIQAADISYQWQWQMGRIIQAEADDNASHPPGSWRTVASRRQPLPLPKTTRSLITANLSLRSTPIVVI